MRHGARAPYTEYTGGGILVKSEDANKSVCNNPMAHTVEEKKSLLNRVHRMRGQMEALERSIDEEAECSEVLHGIAVCRGALDSLMAEVIEGHIRFHVLDPDRNPTKAQNKAAADLIDALKTYLK